MGRLPLFASVSSLARRPAIADDSSQKTGIKAPPSSGSRRALDLLEKINALVGRTEDYQEALEGAVRVVAVTMDCEVCSLYSYDAHTETLGLAATKGLPARAIGRISMPKHEGLVGMVVENADVVCVEDALSHPRFKFFAALGEEKYHSFLGAPVGEGEGIIGVLVLQSRRRRRFLADEISLLRSVAGHIRTVMVNARLAERLQREEKERESYRRGMTQAIRRLEAHEASEKRRRTVVEGTGAEGVSFTGHGVSPGFGLGHVHLAMPPADLDHVVLHEGDPGVELERFEDALRLSTEEVERARVHMRDLVPEVGGDIYEALGMVILDPSFGELIRSRIGRGMAAESALKDVVEEYVERFRAMEDEYLRERASDVRDVGQRILRHLMGVSSHTAAELPEDTVLVAAELTLSDLSTVDPSRLKAIVSAAGGTTSHAAILAKSLEIPTAVGVDGVFTACREGDDIIVDGNSGSVYLRPDVEVLAEYRRLDSQFKVFQKGLEELRDLPAETLDGHRITLLANIGLIGDLDFADEHGAEGVGLYRTEFPFLSYRDFPSENEQLSLYRRVIERMDGRPVTIRTLDLGADKYPSYVSGQREQNPFLGWRSIRISLEYESLFQEQLRAILRAAGRSPLRILFPMITSVEEVRRVREIYSECVNDLAVEGQAPPKGVELGAMIEVPSAVMRVSQIVREVDFVSIGTNDLIQYTLAVDRDNRRVAPMYEPLHPAVLQSIVAVAGAAHDAGRRVGMCGEMAANPMSTLFLLGVGLDELSMGPLHIPLVKKLVRAVSMEDAESLASEILRYDTVEEIKGYIFSRLRELDLIEMVESFS